MRLLLAVALLLPFVASAASEQLIAVHPLAVVGVSPAEAEEFSTAFASELAKLDLDLADGAAVRTFLENKNASCQGDDACLAELAKSVSAASSLWVTFAPFSPKMVISAKVIRLDGTTARSVLGLEFERASKTPSQQHVRAAFKKLFDTLRLTSPELVSLVEPANSTNNTTNNATTSTPTTVTQTPPGRSSRATIGMGVGAVGVGALALGAIFAMQAQASWDSFEQLYQGGVVADSDRADLIAFKERGQSQQTTALIAAGAGAVLTGVGLALYLTDSPSDSPSAAVSLTPTGVAISGAF